MILNRYTAQLNSTQGFLCFWQAARNAPEGTPQLEPMNSGKKGPLAGWGCRGRLYTDSQNCKSTLLLRDSLQHFMHVIPASLLA